MNDWLGAGRWRIAASLILAAAIAGFILAPVLAPYYWLSKEYGLTRSIAESRQFSSTWTDYLYTGARVHYALWSHAFNKSAEANFPGLVALALAVFGIVSTSQSNRHVRMAMAIVVGAVLLSVAPRLPGFEWAHAHLPGLGAIRAYARAAQIAMVGLGLLAAAGVVALRGRLRNDRRWPIVAGALILLVNVEALRAPMKYTPFEGTPAIYDVLQTPEHSAVVELPIYRLNGVFLNAEYMVNATRHWKPIVNGYSGFVPPSYGLTTRILNRFPDPSSFAWLREHGVTTVVLHRVEFAHRKGQQRLALVDQSPELEMRANSGNITIYRIRNPP